MVSLPGRSTCSPILRLFGLSSNDLQPGFLQYWCPGAPRPKRESAGRERRLVSSFILVIVPPRCRASLRPCRQTQIANVERNPALRSACSAPIGPIPSICPLCCLANTRVDRLEFLTVSTLPL